MKFVWSNAQGQNTVRGNSKGNSHSISEFLRKNGLLTPMSWRWGDGSGPSSSRRLIFHREPVPRARWATSGHGRADAGCIHKCLSQSFNLDWYSVYFQLHNDSSGQVITVTPEKSWERSRGGTLLIFLSGTSPLDSGLPLWQVPKLATSPVFSSPSLHSP